MVFQEQVYLWLNPTEVNGGINAKLVIMLIRKGWVCVNGLISQKWVLLDKIRKGEK